MKEKFLLIMVFSAVFSFSLFSQAPTPVISCGFEGTFDDDNSVVTLNGMGSVTFVVDDVRGAVAVFPGGSNAEGNYIDIDTMAYKAYSDVTYNCWIKAEEVSNWARIWTFATEGAQTTRPEAFVTVSNVRTSNQLALTWDNGAGSGVDITSGSVIEINKWYMVTASLSASTGMKLWLNGTAVADTSFSAGNPKTHLCANGYLGKSGWPDPLYKGLMDDFTVYDKVLTDNEVTALWDDFDPNAGEEPDGGEEPNGIDLNSNPDFNIYSSKGIIKIENKINAEISNVAIYNIVGNIIYSTNENIETINNNLSAGVYIVKVKSDLGVAQSKISIQ